MSNNLSFADSDAQDSGLLPDFCDVRVIFMLILLVEVFAMVLVAASPVGSFWDQFAFISMLMQWIGLLNAALLCGTRKWLNKLPQTASIIASFSLMILVSLVFCLLALGLESWLSIDEITSPLGEHFLLRIMLISAAIYAVVLRYFFIQQQWKLHLQAYSKAEIQALRARIRPHFLFNSMNTIASLISFQPDKAEKAVEDLAVLFRASLREQNIHTLADELALTKSYLDIELLRLGDRLKLFWEIEPGLENTEIPALCLQPLVENAIYHGIEPLPGGGLISVSASSSNNRLVLTVSNPVGKNAISSHKSNHMAQENIRQRLQLAYGKEAEFRTNETQTNYAITLVIPLGTVNS